MKTINTLMIDELSEREINWIHDQLGYTGPYIDGTEQKRALIKNYIQSEAANYTQVCDLLLQSKARLLPNNELAWIEEHDYRLLRWMGHYCSAPSPHILGRIPTLFNIPLTDSLRYRNFVKALDDWNEELYRKRFIIEQVRIAWSEVLLKDSKLTWLKEGDQSQMDWAWDYMLSNRVIPYFLTPTNTEEKYSNIMSVFDCWQSSPEKLQLLQIKMSRAWAQQKYRANLKNEKKKQSTYSLSVDAKSQLQMLAKERNINLNKMLEHIIDQAFKNSKKGKSEEQ